MKRINIYINQDTNAKINAISNILQKNRSNIIRNAIEEYFNSYYTSINNFSKDLVESQDDNIWIKTANEQNEFNKYINDPLYFIENAVTINTKTGLQKFKLYDFQKELLFIYENYEKTILNVSRQIGNSTLLLAYALFYLLSNSNKTVLFAMPTTSLCEYHSKRFRDMLNNLPACIQNNIKTTTDNKRQVTLSNNSKIIFSPIHISSIRGWSFNLIILNDFAFTKENNAKDFLDCLLPISQNAKMIISSAPNGSNFYLKLWADAVTTFNNFHAIKVPWYLVPGQDEDWKKQQILRMGESHFRQEYECSFETDDRCVLKIQGDS